MLAALLVFGSTFMAVFFLGLQSLNVNQGRYVAAAVTSFFISTGHIWLYKLMPDSGWVQLVGYYAGGIVGITASIWLHPRIKVGLAAINQRWTDLRARQRLARAIARRRGPPRPIPTPLNRHEAPVQPPRGWPADTHDVH